MKKYIYGFSLAVLVVTCYALLAACATSPTTPKQAIYQIKQDYAAALSAAVIYDSLPPCTASLPGVLCSEGAIKNKIKQAKDIASPVIQAAEDAVRDPSFDKSTADAVTTAAREAVHALTQIIAQLPVPKASKPTGMITMHAPHTAAVPLLYILGLLDQLLSLVPAGSALWQKFSGQKTKFEQMVKDGRDPTDEEWTALDAEVKALEAQVDAGAAQG